MRWIYISGKPWRKNDVCNLDEAKAGDDVTGFLGKMA